MRLLYAATVVTADPDDTADRYAHWLDYTVAEHGVVPPELAQAWGAPASAGRRYVVCQPASGAPVYLRFVQGAPVKGYKPLRTYGWNAVEICVQDVLTVNERMERSPFEIIGPPKPLDGLPAIFPMQVKGPDQEIVYLTQILDDLPMYDLPRAAALIDKLFILVLGCSDLQASARWLEEVVGLEAGREMDLVYTMLSEAFGLPQDQQHTIATLTHGRDVFIEIDQYPKGATGRPAHANELPPGIAICTLLHPDIDGVPRAWLSPPAPRAGLLYGGRRSGVLQGPDGVLVELIEA